MTNTYISHNNDFVVRRPKTFVEETRGWATLPKDLGSTVHHNNNFINNEPKPQQRYRSNTIGFKEAVKSKFTIFGTLLRPRKLRRGFKKKGPKKGDDPNRQSSSKEKPIDVTKHNEPLNYDDCGNLISGQLEKLVYLMTPTCEYYPDQNYIFTFLLCSRLFMPPANLLRKLVDNLKVMIEKNKKQEHELFKKFVALLLDWSKQFPYDFKDKLMMAQFNKFSSMLKTSYPDLSASLNLIAIHLVGKFKELLAYVEKSKEFQILCDEEEKKFFDVCQDPIVVAEQLTLIELEKMSKLNSEQFVEKFIAEDITCSRLDLTESNKHATTLELYVSWFNRLSYLVATEICAAPKKRDRVKMVNFFIDVGKHCLKIGNFNSLMAIITGLNMNAVGRMSKTWKQANKGKFRKLESELDPKGNFSKYRETLKFKMESRENDFMIPVFSIFVKDVYFLNEGIKDKLPNGMVNYTKFTQLSKNMKDFLSRRNKRCYYLRKDDIIDYFLETPVMGENGIYKSSFEVEKPDNNFERDRFQSVRMRMGHTVDLR